MIELRSSRPVHDVMLHFVARAAAAPARRASPRVGSAGAGSPGAGGDAEATATSAQLAQPVLDAGPGQPPIIARSAWAQGARAPRGPRTTARSSSRSSTTRTSPNGYSRATCRRCCSAIFDYHRFVRGFFDIAYNFMIDAFGRIWEARAGGIDEPVIGAHAGGYNGESTGVAVLGHVHVRCAAAGRDPLRSSTCSRGSSRCTGSRPWARSWSSSIPRDAFYTPFAPGAHVPLPRVAGHRDGDLTDCPGNAFYDRLPAIRPRIAALEGVPASADARRRHGDGRAGGGAGHERDPGAAPGRTDRRRADRGPAPEPRPRDHARERHDRRRRHVDRDAAADRARPSCCARCIASCRPRPRT